MLHASLRQAAPRPNQRWRWALSRSQRAARLPVCSVSTQQPSTPPGLAPLPWDGTPEQLQVLLSEAAGCACPRPLGRLASENASLRSKHSRQRSRLGQWAAAAAAAPG